jgi:hypothetical protein
VGETRVVAWSRREPAAIVVPPSVKHVQLIITRGWAADERYAWLVFNGTELLGVYRSANDDIAPLVEAIIKATYATAGTPFDEISFHMMGSIKPPPPPPPPDPGGIPGLVERFPRTYVEGVLRAAWNLNYDANLETAQLNGTSAGL